MSKYIQKEPFEAPDIGAVEVRSLLLSERMKASSLAGDDEGRFIPYMLACCVLKDGAPVFSEQGWDEYGSMYQNEALEMFSMAHRLSGFDAVEVEKK
jgi:hypothetical protein